MGLKYILANFVTCKANRKMAGLCHNDFYDYFYVNCKSGLHVAAWPCFYSWEKQGHIIKRACNIFEVYCMHLSWLSSSGDFIFFFVAILCYVSRDAS